MRTCHFSSSFFLISSTSTGVSIQSVQGHRSNQEGVQGKLGYQGRTSGAAFSFSQFFIPHSF